MRKYKTVAMIALTLSIVGGAFALPSFASVQAVDDYQYDADTHYIDIYRPRRELVPDSGGLGDSVNIDRNYINAFEKWEVYEGKGQAVQSGTPITYTIDIYKQEAFSQGQYSGTVDIGIKDNYTGAQERYQYSTHIVNNGIMPTGVTWRLKGVVETFKEVDYSISADGTEWYYAYQLTYEITLEAGKGAHYSLYLYNPQVEWLRFEDIENDQSKLDDFLVNYGTAFDRIEVVDIRDTGVGDLLTDIYEGLGFQIFSVAIFSVAILSFIIYGKKV